MSADKQEPVAWAISYDGATPCSIWSYGDGALLDLEVRRIGGSASKMPLYTSPQQEPDRLDSLGPDKIRGAVARGWCHPLNAAKVMDSDLALAIAAEVSAAIDAAKEAKP